MATTGYSSTGAFFNTGVGVVRIHGDIVYNVTRTNNTVYFTDTYARIKYVRESGSWTSFTYSGWTWKLYVTSGTHRRTNTGSGTRSVDQVNDGTKNSFSFSVGANDTSVSARVGAYFSGDGETFANKTLTIPALGAPTGLSRTATSITRSSATLGASLSSWGTSATAGTGQRIEYKRNADSSWTNLAYSTATSHTRAVTGLISNTRYNLRSYALNGGGKNATSSTIDFYTLPQAPSVGSPTIEATTATVPTSLNTGGGAYTITTAYRYRETGGTWGSWTNYTGNQFILTGLTPSLHYEVQTRSTTTAGTTEGSVTPLETLPAGKIIMPDGSVVNAVPHIVAPDGAVSMVNVRVIQP